MIFPFEIGRKRISYSAAKQLLSLDDRMIAIHAPGRLMYLARIFVLSELMRHMNDLWIPSRRFETLYGIRTSDGIMFQTDHKKLQSAIDGNETFDK